MSQQVTILMAQLEVSKCTAELYLNDIPLLRLTPKNLPVENVAVEEFALAGTNTLEILVEPGDRPSLARSPRRSDDRTPMRAVARLLRFAAGAPGTAEHGDLLAQVEFQGAEMAEETRMLPVSVRREAQVDLGRRRFTWQDGPPLSLGGEWAGAVRVLEDIECAIVSGDANRLSYLMRHKIRDILDSYPAWDAVVLRRELEEIWLRNADPSEPVERGWREGLDFRLAAGGRLIQCVNQDWRGSIVLRKKSGARVPQTLFLGRTEGELVVMR